MLEDILQLFTLEGITRRTMVMISFQAAPSDVTAVAVPEQYFRSAAQAIYVIGPDVGAEHFAPLGSGFLPQIRVILHRGPVGVTVAA
jgi:hypothetical protein